jgi:cell division protein FtsB
MQKDPFYQEKSTPYSDREKNLIAIIIILLIALAGTSYWAFFKKQENTIITNENVAYQSENKELISLRDSLVSQVESLSSNFAALSEENQSLQGSLNEAKVELASKIKSLSLYKKNSAKEANNLRAEILQLLAVKAELEESISALQEENDNLKVENTSLTTNLNEANKDNAALANLNRTMQEEVKKLTLNNFKASAFQVEVENPKSKLTVKSNKARRIVVNFDLTSVPDEYQGVRIIYMAITNDNGIPVPGSNISKNIVVNGQSMPLNAVSGKEVNITSNQRLSFSHNMEDKLKPGFYRVAVYTDIGMLGSANFRLD